jgi:hypothetical protein
VRRVAAANHRLVCVASAGALAVLAAAMLGPLLD